MLLVLIILDGWGIASASEYNAITNAKTPNFDKLLKSYPSFLLNACGEILGCPKTKPGSSETGHLILGTGRTYDKIKEAENSVKNFLSEILARANLKQLYISETEKFIYLTYFFGGMSDSPPPGAEWINIPSAEITSYKQKPEMSAREITRRVIKEISADKYNFIAVNFANPDMVGHTGDLRAAIRAVETADSCLGDIAEIVLAKEGAVIITSDHGNAEETKPLGEGEFVKPHTKNRVPCIIIEKSKKGDFVAPYQKSGTLADAAPTILKLFGIKKPRLMAGRSLI